MDHGNRVLQKGLTFEKIGLRLIFTLLGGIVLLILVVLIGAMMGNSEPVSMLFFVTPEGYEFVPLLVGIAYLAIVAGSFGIPLYFFGLVYVGLGQIAVNTGKGRGKAAQTALKKSIERKPEKRAAEALVSQSGVSRADDFECDIEKVFEESGERVIRADVIAGDEPENYENCDLCKEKKEEILRIRTADAAGVTREYFLCRDCLGKFRRERS
ncbi:MAG: hypothetical protein J6Z79_05250 [Clostridia bacterium]|nr:hypothetical protein [Clostridia bacterium]